MGFSIDGLDQFQNALIDFVNIKFPEELEKEILELANRLLAKVKKRTPVGVYKDGTSGGDLRKNWQIGNLVRDGSEYYIEVFNNLHYAPHVEYGHRTRLGKTSHPETYKPHGKIAFVPGRHMLKISVEELNKELPVHLSAWLDRTIKELGL
ncbi:HK97 gp10 family phage protein [Clostridium scatologenes]|uniref:HK97 gp10 family phage protein n=1 Tax=Clostridium scatologenes TaxID=1548 RepID=A0A0E3M796_CLOSL|nr:HK97 gp10 family phage protein [Clostridium scatologenes]AKA68547.1 hypothetical protein CSCA_1422 [Clostridium scatologenes]